MVEESEDRWDDGLQPDKRNSEAPTTKLENKSTDFKELLKEGVPNRFLNLQPLQFEQFISELFTDLGYSARLTKGSGDYGADIVVSKKGVTTAVQVKRYDKKNKVGVQDVNQVMGAKEYYGADKTMVITTSSFSSAAKNLAQNANILLWDWEKLKAEIERLYFGGKDVYDYFTDEYESEGEATVSDTSGPLSFEVVKAKFMGVHDDNLGDFRGLRVDVNVRNNSDQKINFDFGTELFGFFSPLVIDTLGNQFEITGFWHDSFTSGYIYPRTSSIIKMTLHADNISNIRNIKHIVIRYFIGDEALPPNQVYADMKEAFVSIPDKLYPNEPLRISSHRKEEQRNRKGPEDKSSYCFIATAAYGTPFSNKINVLRAWRDHHLSNNKIGQTSIDIYYKISPLIARYISRSEKLRAITRKLLDPLIRIIKTRINKSRMTQAENFLH